MNRPRRNIIHTARELRIERLFDVLRALIYEARTNPALLSFPMEISA